MNGLIYVTMLVVFAALVSAAIMGAIYLCFWAWTKYGPYRRQD